MWICFNKCTLKLKFSLKNQNNLLSGDNMDNLLNWLPTPKYEDVKEIYEERVKKFSSLRGRIYITISNISEHRGYAEITSKERAVYKTQKGIVLREEKALDGIDETYISYIIKNKAGEIIIYEQSQGTIAKTKFDIEDGAIVYAKLANGDAEDELAAKEKKWLKKQADKIENFENEYLKLTAKQYAHYI